MKPEERVQMFAERWGLMEVEQHKDVVDLITAAVEAERERIQDSIRKTFGLTEGREAELHAELVAEGDAHDAKVRDAERARCAKVVRDMAGQPCTHIAAAIERGEA